MARVLRNHTARERNGISDSLIRIELITHFHRNPGLEGSVPELAESIGRDLSRVEDQMKKLVQLNILDEKAFGGELRYRYIPPHYVSRRRERGQKATAGERNIYELQPAPVDGIQQQR
ncbi:MAG: hypothetical protein A2V52_02735 [Actinobacteria bacterium RBG_19FT_COMBO_54_7]|uniref:Uncharacterized protein n=1 Tax=Candidatus Solincola sediminis TaxID=1797199 RepID=A0A1F2WGL4_9ACTN|nr:MAG: hypothetical protein A2Y75_04545 [Candidatus Solincola sediminis]OFW66968.1 MAG: hypothetical protein A2V52_02735 [Actinobacteria bacterium RBG_19FT_COMBO_54_7]